MGKLWIVGFALAILNFWGCSEDSGDSSVILYPDNRLKFWVFPNDGAQNDSASAVLAHGIRIKVHPQTIYRLSFEADTSAGAPNLQLFRLYDIETSSYRARQVRVLEPTLEKGRYVYQFLCEEKEMNQWAVTLEKDGTFYTGSSNDLRIEGDGAYSDTLTLNLVVAGDVEDNLNDFTLDELAAAILQGFRQEYKSIVVDTLYVNYADKHPKVGTKYPRDKIWYAGKDGDVMMTDLGGGWPGVGSALNLVLSRYIEDAGLMGYSILFSGNLGEGDGSTVVLGAYVRNGITLYPLSQSAIVETAVHESGHFFGLRHTTSSRADMNAMGDYSVVEDGLSDTPYCEGLLRSGLVKTTTNYGTDIYTGPKIRRTFEKTLAKGSFSVESCPDIRNYMFPLGTSLGYDGFTDQQLDVIRKNLMIFPH